MHSKTFLNQEICIFLSLPTIFYECVKLKKTEIAHSICLKSTYNFDGLARSRVQIDELHLKWPTFFTLFFSSFVFHFPLVRQPCQFLHSVSAKSHLPMDRYSWNSLPSGTEPSVFRPTPSSMHFPYGFWKAKRYFWTKRSCTTRALGHSRARQGRLAASGWLLREFMQVKSVKMKCYTSRESYHFGFRLSA